LVMFSLSRHVHVLAGLTLLGVFTATAHAAAVSVSCPGTAATTDREFAVTTDPGTAGCLASGTGNINGNNDAINLLGYITLDKSDDATTGVFPLALTGSPSLVSGLSGTFSFSAPGYTDFVIAFKTGQGKPGEPTLDPDWAAFTLPAGVTSGSWSISGQQDLSHAVLYGKLSPVPLPAAAWLLLSGVAGLGALARRRRSLAA
jgi:hypothetical protein